MSRIFRKIDGGLRSALAEDQMNTPGAFVGLLFNEEETMRSIIRAYHLGRKDKASEIRGALKEP